MTHFAALATIILPIFLLPYLLTKRRLNLLHRQVDELGTAVRILHRDLNGLSSELAARKDEHRRMRMILADTMRETDELRSQAEQREAKQLDFDEGIRGDIQKLLDETQHSRTQGATLRALGSSLADVAAFIHEVELEMGMQGQGKDHRGVEKLRLLAMRMESLPQQNKISSEFVARPPTDGV